MFISYKHTNKKKMLVPWNYDVYRYNKRVYLLETPKECSLYKYLFKTRHAEYKLETNSEW